MLGEYGYEIQTQCHHHADIVIAMSGISFNSLDNLTGKQQQSLILIT